jgi:hypothetical protein
MYTSAEVSRLTSELTAMHWCCQSLAAVEIRTNRDFSGFYAMHHLSSRCKAAHSSATPSPLCSPSSSSSSHSLISAMAIIWIRWRTVFSRSDVRVDLRRCLWMQIQHFLKASLRCGFQIMGGHAGGTFHRHKLALDQTQCNIDM